MKKQRNFGLTTVALEDNQHLQQVSRPNMVETYCEGYTDHKRDKSLDGYYFNAELTIKRLTINNPK